MSRGSFVLLWALFVSAPSAAWAQLDCLVPTREDTSGSGLTLSSPGLAPIRKAALAVEAIVRKNALFMGGARPIRVRTTISYSHSQPWTATIFTGAYNKEAWVGACELSPFADRGGGLRDGWIRVTLNEPRALLGYPVGGDAQLESFEAPQPVAPTAGFQTYKDATGTTTVLTVAGTLPLVAVTIIDALDVEERRLRERLAEWEREKQRPWMTDAKVQKCFDMMKAVDPTKANDACAPLRQAQQSERDQRLKRETEGDARFAAQREDLRAYRASFSTAQLHAAASPNGQRPSGIGRVDDPTGRQLVKVDPAFARLDPNRVHVIYVAGTAGPTTDPVPGRHMWMARSLEAVDYAALAALLQ